LHDFQNCETVKYYHESLGTNNHCADEAQKKFTGPTRTYDWDGNECICSNFFLTYIILIEVWLRIGNTVMNVRAP
jgi:hypothetical protein